MTQLLDGVNAVLKRHRLIHGSSGNLTTLTSPAIQVAIDLAVDCWNEAIADLYSIAEKGMPSEMSSSSIVLATGTRAYVIPDDVVIFRWPLQCSTNNQYITQYPGGYEALIADQVNPSDYTGLPQMGCVRATDGNIYLDRAPTSAENGLTYTFLYDKELMLDEAADEFPFNRTVYQMLVPVVTELVRRDLKKSFDERMYDKRLSRAAAFLRKEPLETNYMPERYSGASATDPLDGD